MRNKLTVSLTVATSNRSLRITLTAKALRFALVIRLVKRSRFYHIQLGIHCDH